MQYLANYVFRTAISDQRILTAFDSRKRQSFIGIVHRVFGRTIWTCWKKNEQSQIIDVVIAKNPMTDRSIEFGESLCEH